MQPGDRSDLSGHEADRGGARSFRRHLCPEIACRRPIMKMDITKAIRFQSEDHVLVLHLLGPLEVREQFGSPAFQKTGKGQQARIVSLLKRIEMPPHESSVLLGGSLAFARGDAERVRCFVPKEIGDNSSRPGNRLRYQAQWAALFPSLTDTQVDYIGDAAIFVERDEEPDLLGGVTKGGYIRQPLIGFREGREDTHCLISGECGCGTRITPSSRMALKKRDGRPSRTEGRRV